MHTSGGFTLPGEAGYEDLTLRLADLWGADCIRDSDGTQLSEKILDSGLPIYSTLCMVRNVNEFAKAHPEFLQRNFLMTRPVPAMEETLTIRILDDYFPEQFTLCPQDDPREFWQVFDRTTGQEHTDWSFDEKTKEVTVRNAVPYHLYTVNFLALRIWEEISMYNHITNDWGDREHLMAVEPRYPETQEVLLCYLRRWCEDHPATKVVRFTSLFYNFVWIWGSRPEHRHLYADWGSYDFTVNPVSLREFEKEYGYRMTSEDFIHMGQLHSAHMPPSQKQWDWMEFTGKFVRSFARKCIDIVHEYGKLAYVFYDDSWIGLEPWSGHFDEFGFDGLIKCVFNAFEARLCAGVKEVKNHELRLHPYLFPTGLQGEPTFSVGGHPEEDAKRFWINVRRGLLRAKIERIGLGGYLSLTEPFPAFQEEIARIADEFRLIRSFHEKGAPRVSGIRVGILQSWGSLRTWNCAGHMHEHPELPLNHIHEALAGMPVELRSVKLSDVAQNGVPEDIDVLINAGREGDAWSGGSIWENPDLTAAIQSFVARGGAFLGVGEPGAIRGGMRHFALGDMLGVDQEVGLTICAEKYPTQTSSDPYFGSGETPVFHNAVHGVYPLSHETRVLYADGKNVVLALHDFGKGHAAYLNGFSYSTENARMLYKLLFHLTGKREQADEYLPDCASCDAAVFPDAGKIVVISSDEANRHVTLWGDGKKYETDIPTRGCVILDL